MNAKPNRVLVLVLVTAVTLVVAASFRLRTETAAPAGQAGGASDKMPNAAMQKLTAALTGKWNIEETASPIASDGKAVVARGTEEWGTKPGGIPFYEAYHSNGSDGDEDDHAIFWWDASENKVKGMFCAAFNTEGCSPFVVEWKDGQFVMTGEYKSGTNVIAWTENFKMSGPDAFTQTLAQGIKDHSQQLASTIRATRIK